MKIVLATCGSRGDVQPMITLCLALKAAGHETLLIGPPEKAAWAKKLGCPYMPFGRDVTSFINTMEDVIRISTALSFISFVREEIKSQFRLLPKIIGDADLVIASSLMFSLSSIAEAAQTRYRYVAFTPHLFPSNDHPFLIFKTQTWPKWLNQLSWKAARTMDRFNITHLLNRCRKEMGLPPIKDAWEHILGDAPIAACDRQVAAIPEDVPQRVVQTGFLHPELPCPERPDLEAFLAKGPAPAYAGFGSMPPKDQEKTIPLLIAAARMACVRIIILKFWGGPPPVPESDDVFYINAYPHLELFPRMAAIIHHGGAGTTAAAAVSGVPQIIVPHILDQYFHGQKIYTSSLGPRPIWKADLTRKKLAAALKACLTDPKIKATARRTGGRIDPSASIASIVREIENS